MAARHLAFVRGAETSVIARRFERLRVPTVRVGGTERVAPGSTALVVGGGIAGLAAATVLAERGVSVTVLEKDVFLGGRAGAWSERLADGTPFEMERGFHGFFRQYYNLRAMLRRVDPALSFLTPLTDYPLLGPNGARESFSRLPKHAPFNIVELIRRTDSLKLRDLPRVGARSALAMLAYDGDATYADYDDLSARDYLDSLKFPDHARQMLFDVFSHSFFNPEEGLSAAELLMSFHFYFMGNPEGLVFDVLDDAFSTALWNPYRDYLESLGVRFRMATAVRSLALVEGGYRAELDGGGVVDANVAVLAVAVPALKRLVAASPDLDRRGFAQQIARTDVTLPFFVLRLWLDRPVDPSRAAFVGTAGLGILDNISVYERFEKESRRWAESRGGSVVELHAYAAPVDMDESALRDELLGRLHHLYPETRDAEILHEHFLLRRDCPAFPPGSYRQRPTVETPLEGLALAGDFVKTPFPSALMERAAATGFMAANHVLARFQGREEPLWSVPPRGILAGFGANRLRWPWGVGERVRV
jgi:isorenieratene synthase